MSGFLKFWTPRYKQLRETCRILYSVMTKVCLFCCRQYLSDLYKQINLLHQLITDNTKSVVHGKRVDHLALLVRAPARGTQVLTRYTRVNSLGFASCCSLLTTGPECHRCALICLKLNTNWCGDCSYSLHGPLE